MKRIILTTDKTAGFPTMTEIGIRGLFRLTVEITPDTTTLKPLSRGSYDNIVVFGRFLRFGLTVKTPITGTIRSFGFDR